MFPCVDHPSYGAPLHLSAPFPSLSLPRFWYFPDCVQANKRPLPSRGISPRPGGPKRPDVLVKCLSGYEFWYRRGERGATEPAATTEGEKRGEKTHARKPVQGSDITDNLQSSAQFTTSAGLEVQPALGLMLSCPPGRL